MVVNTLPEVVVSGATGLVFAIVARASVPTHAVVLLCLACAAITGLLGMAFGVVTWNPAKKKQRKKLRWVPGVVSIGIHTVLLGGGMYLLKLFNIRDAAVILGASIAPMIAHWLFVGAADIVPVWADRRTVWASTFAFHQIMMYLMLMVVLPALKHKATQTPEAFSAF